MNKIIAASLVSAALFTAHVGATTATATANWQGVIPGVEGGDSIVIRGLNGAETLPVGQLLFSEDGEVATSTIDLEAYGAAGGVADIASGTIDATWEVTSVDFFANGIPVRGAAWSFEANGSALATVDNTGAITSTPVAAQTIKLSAESVGSKAVFDEHQGATAALSVTVLATKA